MIMQPMGRKYFKHKGSKHHVRIKGKFFAWWLDVCTPNKRRDKEDAKKQIKQDINN